MWWFFFLALTELMRFPVEFCVLKFSSFGQRFDGLWNKEWKEPKLGDAHVTPKIFKNIQKPKLGDAPGRHPLFRLRSLVTLLGAIFLFAT